MFLMNQRYCKNIASGRCSVAVVVIFAHDPTRSRWRWEAEEKSFSMREMQRRLNPYKPDSLENKNGATSGGWEVTDKTLRLAGNGRLAKMGTCSGRRGRLEHGGERGMSGLKGGRGIQTVRSQKYFERRKGIAGVLLLSEKGGARLGFWGQKNCDSITPSRVTIKTFRGK